MSVSRTIRIVLVSLAVAVAGGALTVWLTWPRVERWGVGFHQKSVTQSLGQWGREYASITNDVSAVTAAGMVGYMSSYYIPGPGYRGPVDVEAALEAQRRDSISRVVASLERYTGLDYGTKAQRWTEWAEEREKQLSVQKGSEQGGSANGRHPIRSETNRASSEAGSRR